MAIIDDQKTFFDMDSKATPTGDDLLQIADVADGGRVKKIPISAILSQDGTDTNAIHVDVAAEISGITAKAAPTANDLVVIEDAAAANVKKRVTIGSLPVAQAQVVGILLEPGDDAAVELLGTTSAVVVTVAGAVPVVVTNGAGLYAGQQVQLFASAVAGGGSYTVAVQGGTLTIDATGEAPIIKRNAANDAWVVVSLGGATIV